jgi:hypothetical protein
MVFWRDGIGDKLAIDRVKGPRGPASGGLGLLARRSGASTQGGYPRGVRDGMIRDE